MAERRPVVVDERSEREAEFDRLADEHLLAAYRLAFAILREPSEAQDATHDAFVLAWSKWSTLRDVSRFDPWFDRILINTCRNRLKRAARRRAIDISSEVVDPHGDPARNIADRDLVGTAIADLSPDHAIVVALRYYRDLTIDQIATRLGIPAGTVQSRLHYALKKLHDAIDPDGEGAIR